MKKIFLIGIVFLLLSCNNIEEENKKLHGGKYIEIQNTTNINNIECNNDYINEVIKIKSDKGLLELNCFYKYENGDLQCKKYSGKIKKSKLEERLDGLLAKEQFLVRNKKVIAKGYNVTSFLSGDYMYQVGKTLDEAINNPEILMRDGKKIAEGKKVKSFLNGYYKYSTNRGEEILMKNGKKIDLGSNLYNIIVFEDGTIKYEQPKFLTKENKTIYFLKFKDGKKIKSISEISYINGSYSYTSLKNIAYIIIKGKEIISFDLNKGEYKNIDDMSLFKGFKETGKRILSGGVNSLLTLTHSQDNGDYGFIDPEGKLNLIIGGNLKTINSGMVFTEKNGLSFKGDYSFYDNGTELFYLVRKGDVIAVGKYVASCKNGDFFYEDKNKNYHLMRKK